MKKFAYFMAMVAGVLTSLFSSAAKADCDTYYMDDDFDHENPYEASCGENCCYRISKVTDTDAYGYVTNTHTTATIYADDPDKPAELSREMRSGIDPDTIIIEEGITKISSRAQDFYDAVPQLISIPSTLQEFAGYYLLAGVNNVVIPDNVDTTNWGEYAFPFIDNYDDEYNWLGAKVANIMCKGNIETCIEKLSHINCEAFYNENNMYEYAKCSSQYITPASEEYCIGSNYQWNDGKCEYIGGNNSNNTGGSSAGCGEGQLEKNGGCVPVSQGCGEGYRQIETWCNKIRWTPAEAAQVLTNDNNNTVTITFRK